MKKTKRLVLAVSMLLISAVLLATASFAWFAMNTEVSASGLEVEAYTDSLYLQISENESTGFGTSVIYDVNASGNSANLKLTTNKLANENIYLVTPDSMASAIVYYNAADTKEYYKAVDNKFGGKDYIYANGELEQATDVSTYYTAANFQVVASDAKVTGDYYQFDNVTNEYVLKTVTDASAKGLYTFVSDAAVTGDYAQPGEVYYEKSGDNYVEVKGIKLGTLISDTAQAYYFTVSASAIPADATANAANTYYVKNNKDYSSLGPIADGTALAKYIYWGEAYSTDVADEQAGNTLTIIPTADLNGNYYLTKTVYLQMAEGSNHGANLKVSEVKIGGATNALSDAIRVLFVATSLEDTEAFATATYDNGTKTFDNDLLMGTVLGNTDEVIKVDVYIYFDGTDAIAENVQIAGAQLNGQSVEFKFSVEEFAQLP